MLQSLFRLQHCDLLVSYTQGKFAKILGALSRRDAFAEQARSRSPGTGRG
jgi:hypothetical protein